MRHTLKSGVDRRTLLLSAAASLLPTGRALAAGDPPIRVTVGFPPGGTTDVIARLVCAMLGPKLFRTLYVDNRPGASGNIAAQDVARAAPDGSSLLFIPSSHATNASLYKKLPFDTAKDFAAIGMVATTPYVLVVNPQLPVRSVPEFIAYLKAQPNPVQYASASPGTGQHLAGELFKMMAHVDMTQIPYKGSAAAYPDLLAGRTPVMFDNVAVVLPQVRSGALRALAVTSARRSPLLPDLPTIAQTLPGYEVEGWFALMAPAKTPPSLVQQLNGALNQVIADPGFSSKLAELGAEPVSGTPASAEAFIRGEISRWREVIRNANISLD